MQLTVSLYLLGLAVAQLVFGPLSDRFGRRPVLLAGLALATVASTAAIFAAGIAGPDRRARRAVARRLDRPTIGRAIIRDLYDRERAASMIGLVTSVVVLMPMVAPLIGGILDTAVRLAIDLRVRRAAQRHGVRLGGAGAAGDATASRPRRASAAICCADMRALGASPRFFGYALCAGLGSAPFFTFLGGAPHVVVSMLGRTSAEYGLWFFLPSIGFMAGNFAVSRLTGASPSMP